MSDKNLNPSEDPVNADIQKALIAAFGSEAADWLEQDEAVATDANDVAMRAKTANQPAANRQNGLEDLLSKISSVIGEDNLSAPAPVSDQNNEQEIEQSTLQDGPRHVVFSVGSQQFGIPLSEVREIDRCGKVTSLPRTPAWLRGVTNLRGEILSVTDFRNLLELTEDRQTVGEKIIVVHSERHDARTALVVDRVHGIRNLSGEQGPLKGLTDRIATFADSLAITDQTATVLIDPDRLLGCNELKSFAEG